MSNTVFITKHREAISEMLRGFYKVKSLQPYLNLVTLVNNDFSGVNSDISKADFEACMAILNVMTFNSLLYKMSSSP